MPMDDSSLFNTDYADMAAALLAAGAESGKMNRTVLKKTTLRQADDAFCTEQTVSERLAILAELNRIGLAATGIADAPLLRTAVRKYPFREFRRCHKR